MLVGISWLTSRGPLEGNFEASWGPLWGLLGSLLGLLAASWGLLAIWGINLGRKARNVSWNSPSWTAIGEILSRLGRLFNRLRALLGFFFFFPPLPLHLSFLCFALFPCVLVLFFLFLFFVQSIPVIRTGTSATNLMVECAKTDYALPSSVRNASIK